MSGVYIIEDSSWNKNGNIFIKVGMSKVDVNKRIETIKKNLHLCGMNSNIKVKYIIPCSKPLKVEQLLHKLLKLSLRMFKLYFLTSNNSNILW